MSTRGQENQIELLQCELNLTKQTHVAVVQRLQKRIDELEAALAVSQKHEQQSQQQVDHYAAMEQYHSDNLADACGGYGGERI